MHFKQINSLGKIFKTEYGYEENFQNLRYSLGNKCYKEFYDLLDLKYEIIKFKKRDIYNIIDTIDIIQIKYNNFILKSKQSKIEEEKSWNSRTITDY